MVEMTMSIKCDLNYRFAVENEWNLSVRKARKSNFTVNYSQHFDQLFYIFRLSTDPDIVPDQAYQNLTKTSLQRSVIKTTTDFYTNFMKFG